MKKPKKSLKRARPSRVFKSNEFVSIFEFNEIRSRLDTKAADLELLRQTLRSSESKIAEIDRDRAAMIRARDAVLRDRDAANDEGRKARLACAVIESDLNKRIKEAQVGYESLHGEWTTACTERDRLRAQINLAREALTDAEAKYARASEMYDAKHDEWKKACDERDAARAAVRRESERSNEFAREAQTCAAERNENAAQRDEARAELRQTRAALTAISRCAAKLEDSLRDVLRTAEEVFKTRVDSPLAEGVGADWNAAVGAAKALLSHPQSDVVADADREAHHALRVPKDWKPDVIFVTPGVHARIGVRSMPSDTEITFDRQEVKPRALTTPHGDQVRRSIGQIADHQQRAELAIAKMEVAELDREAMERSLAALRATRSTIDKRLHAARERIRELEAKVFKEAHTTPMLLPKHVVRVGPEIVFETDGDSFLHLHDKSDRRSMNVWRNGVEYVPKTLDTPTAESIAYARAMCDTIEQVRFKHETSSEALDRVIGDWIEIADALKPEAERGAAAGLTHRGKGSGHETPGDVVRRVINDCVKLRDEVAKHRAELQALVEKYSGDGAPKS
jgi:hypothetical protein